MPQIYLELLTLCPDFNIMISKSFSPLLQNLKDKQNSTSTYVCKTENQLLIYLKYIHFLIFLKKWLLWGTLITELVLLLSVEIYKRWSLWLS